MNIKKIIREEIQKLEEKVISLSKDEMSILHRNKEIEKDGHIIRYNDEIEEGFGGEFLSKKERKIFEKERLENAEVLGYKLTGTKDINEATVTFRGARGRSVVVPNEYVGKLGRVEHKLMDMLGYINGKHNIIADWSWGYNSRQKMKPNDEFSSSIILRSHPYIKGGRRELQKGDVKVIIATLNKLLRANRLKIEKPKYRPDVNYPMIEFRVKPNQFKESVFAVNLDKEKNDERHPEQPNINYDPEKGKSRIRKIRENKSLITEGTRWFVGVEMPNGKTTSTYGHWDGYPSYTGKMLKRYYSGGAGKVRDLLKLGKHGISSLDKSMKGGKGHSFENPLPGESVFYGRDRGDKQRMVRNWKNKDSIKFNYYGAEFGYIWSVKDRKWYVKDDSSRADWKVL